MILQRPNTNHKIKWIDYKLNNKENRQAGSQISRSPVSLITLNWHVMPAIVSPHRRAYKLSIKIMRDQKRSQTYILLVALPAPHPLMITAPIALNNGVILMEHQFHWLNKLKTSFTKMKSQKISNLSPENWLKSSQRKGIQMNLICSLAE